MLRYGNSRENPLDYMGLSPKMLVRIARFQRALRMRAVNSGSWSEVAYKLDYFDQMHMIRDFKGVCWRSSGSGAPTNCTPITLSVFSIY